MYTKPHQLGFSLAVLLSALASLPANAQGVTSLRGKPSSDMILEALSPVPHQAAPAGSEVSPEPARRRRGLVLHETTEANTQPAAVESVTTAAPAPAASYAPAPDPTTASAPTPAQAPVTASAPESVPPAAVPAQAVQQAAYTSAAPQLRALDLDIRFEFNSDQLTNDGKDVLDQLAAALKSDRLAAARSVILEGHADAKGSASYNEILSLKRAQSARQYLNSRHAIPLSKVRSIGKGSSEPADPANPEHEINRRVRVIVEI